MANHFHADKPRDIRTQEVETFQGLGAFQPISDQLPPAPIPVITEARAEEPAPAVDPIPQNPGSPEPQAPTAPRRGRPKGKTTSDSEKKKVGRPKKNPADSADSKQLTTISLPKDVHMTLKIMGLLMKVPMSDLISSVCADMVHSTFECEEPECFHRFIVVTDPDGDIQKPQNCPFCGGAKIRRVKYKEVSF